MLSGLDVPRLFLEGRSVKTIAPMVGLGERRVRAIVAGAGLRAAPDPVPSDRMLFAILRHEVLRHGGGYGWGTLCGALRAHHPGYRFPRRRVLGALRMLFPVEARERQDWTAQRLERGRYHAPYTHYSWHMDYACKMQDYGLYVGAIIDGSSRMCLSLRAVTDKLPLTAYTQVLLPALEEHNIVPDQLNTDKGREWDVCAFAVLLLARICPAAQQRLQQSQRPRRAHRYVFSKRNVCPAATPPPPLTTVWPHPARAAASRGESLLACYTYSSPFPHVRCRPALSDSIARLTSRPWFSSRPHQTSSSDKGFLTKKSPGTLPPSLRWCQFCALARPTHHAGARVSPVTGRAAATIVIDH